MGGHWGAGVARHRGRRRGGAEAEWVPGLCLPPGLPQKRGDLRERVGAGKRSVRPTPQVSRQTPRAGSCPSKVSQRGDPSRLPAAQFLPFPGPHGLADENYIPGLIW